jgi:fatty-acyl-CoA synthase
LPGVLDAVTFGVSIPGADGRAGMAAVVVDDRFDLAEFQDRLSLRLPAYACPVIVRFCMALDTLIPSSKRNISWFARDSIHAS